MTGSSVPREPAASPAPAAEFARLAAAAAAVSRGVPQESDVIVVTGAAEHNLHQISVVLPRRGLTVITGVSGSGKSSLAFDTIHAEGQRHYLDSLTEFSRRYVDQLRPPSVGSIAGLGPTVAVRQHRQASNPRSTVGSVTGIGDRVRLLFSRAGDASCRACGAAVPRRGSAELLDAIARLAADGPAELTGQGWTATVRPGEPGGLPASVHAAIGRSEGVIVARTAGGGAVYLGRGLVCTGCGTALLATSSSHFSRNSPAGMCPACEGLGQQLAVDPNALVGDPGQSVRSGALTFYGDRRRHPEKTYWPVRDLPELLAEFGADLDTAWKELEPAVTEIILHGDTARPLAAATQRFLATRRDSGLAPQIERLFRAAPSDRKSYYGRFMASRPCPECAGSGLAPDALAVRLAGETVATVGQLAVPELLRWVEKTAQECGGVEAAVAAVIRSEVEERARALTDVGLDYLSLYRVVPTLSAGESQRLRIARQLGCPLIGIVYVLDEPTIGLHPRDHQRLFAALRRLCDAGCTVIVVEHDREMIRRADWVIDLGPGGGADGGRVVAIGTPSQVAADAGSLTGALLREQADRPARQARAPGSAFLSLTGATLHNLKKVSVELPIGLLTCLIGVSGSGKSSLMAGTLDPAVRVALATGVTTGGNFDTIRGAEAFSRVALVDQRPFGRSSRSVPATYLGALDEIRRVLAASDSARQLRLAATHFSFNSAVGQCPGCGGLGEVTVEMHFLPDVSVRCSQCEGKRYRPEVLAARWRGMTIADVLELDIDSALKIFADHEPVAETLAAASMVGLGYLALGQNCATLSGGEAQRLKLSRELRQVSHGRCLYLIDEPSTGLHATDVARLIALLDRLTAAANTVVVIEHNVDVIRCADWIIELGPGGGPAGGQVLAAGPPAQVAATDGSTLSTLLTGNHGYPAKR
jgi:excinuclease ABC subunit A